jgi:sugar lactone lactonase YvrE
LLAADLSTARCEVLLDSMEGQRIRLCNNLSVGGDGTIYFSESTTRYDFDEVHWDILEGVPSGRLIAFKIGAAPRILVDELLFANGVAVAPDQSCVVVAESTGMRLRQYWLSGPRKGMLDVFAELPGLPDNISVGSDGLLWVAMPSHGDAAIKKIHRFPRWIKKLLARVMHGKSVVPKAFGIMAFQWDGTIVHDWVGDSAKYLQPTGVREFQGRVYLASILHGDVARLQVPGRNLKS